MTLARQWQRLNGSRSGKPNRHSVKRCRQDEYASWHVIRRPEYGEDLDAKALYFGSAASVASVPPSPSILSSSLYFSAPRRYASTYTWARKSVLPRS